MFYSQVVGETCLVPSCSINLYKMQLSEKYFCICYKILLNTLSHMIFIVSFIRIHMTNFQGFNFREKFPYDLAHFLLLDIENYLAHCVSYLLWLQGSLEFYFILITVTLLA